MPKLPVITARKLLKILRKTGFEIDHITGSHYILYRRIDGKRTTIPYHNKDIKPGTLHSILKSVGLRKEDLH